MDKALPKEDASIAGPMPVMANVMLSTRRPVVNHPHYEDVGLRERTKQIYKMYSRSSIQEYHDILVGLKAKYLVVAAPWCFSKGKCSMGQMWDDVVQPERANTLPLLCPQLYGDRKDQKLTPHPKPFKRIFKNSQYVVLQV